MFQNNLNNEYSGYEDLVNAENSLERYNKHIANYIYKLYYQVNFSKPNTIVDFGAGTGFLTNKIKSLFGQNILCIEIDPKLTKKLEKNFKVFSKLESIDSTVDLVFSSNVLEHIENDVATLQDIWNKLDKNGYLILYLPARMSLFSELDESVGHFRRYEISELRNKLESVKFEIISLRNVDCLGYLASKAIRIFGYKSKFGIGNKKSLEFYDKVIFPISIFLDFLSKGLIPGKNIICIARKTFLDLK